MARTRTSSWTAARGAGKPEREDFDYYFEGVSQALDELDADVYMLQEVDEDSARSYGTNEVKSFSEGRNAHSWAYAQNYLCPFVPFPWPPMGRMNSGIMTTADYAVQGGTAERIALPCPFSWPVRTANLKRCLLITRYQIPELDSELVVVNLHLEAYDDGEGKAAQTAMLFEVLEAEYAKGSYCHCRRRLQPDLPRHAGEMARARRRVLDSRRTG